MKKVIAILIVALSFSFAGQAQDMMKKDHKKMMAKKVSLEQTPREFTQKDITLKEGTYVFEIANNNAGGDVGFVLVPKGKDASKPENHIKNAYVTEVVKEGKKQSSNEVVLTKGEYVYFCPMNPTPQYTLTVE